MGRARRAALPAAASESTAVTADRVPGRTGRRRGNPDTREAILCSARTAFARNGFAGATIRSIAAGARVDPALVHHYFGTKDALFLATVSIPVNPRDVVDTLTDGPSEELGVRLVAAVLGMWESPAGAALAAVVRTAVSDPRHARSVREFLLHQVISRVLRRIDCPPAEVRLRGALLASQVAGLIVGRYILALEPLASQPLVSLLPDIGATLQRYLTAPLAAPVAPPPGEPDMPATGGTPGGNG